MTLAGSGRRLKSVETPRDPPQDLSAFERAERRRPPKKRAHGCTFRYWLEPRHRLELSGALAEIARETHAARFSKIDPQTGESY